MTSITIAERTIGPGHPCWVVAELSGNHRSDYGTALRLIEVAKDAGADAVKVQCFTPDAMTLQSDAQPFRLTWASKQRTLYDLYAETAMPLEWHSRLRRVAECQGLTYFASIFDWAGVDFCEHLGLPCYKIASSEIIDTPLIRYAASKGRPLILSTGMATQREIREAIEAADEGIKDRIRLPENRVLASPAAVALLKCTTAYPADTSDANLKTLDGLRYIAPYRQIIGLSDHTLGIAVPVAAVALGACIIEKHLTLSRADGGPDAAFSLEPAEFKAMVDAVRTVGMALGEVRYGPTEAEQPMLRFRRSLWVVVDVAAGERFTPASVRSLRPATGLEPKHLDEVLGKVATRNIAAGTALQWEMVEKD